MTPHNRAGENDFADTVIMPGDPLRAKYIVENFLDDYHLVTDVRNIYGYTGHYKGKEVSVMASGMGIPSMGIYAYELFKFYNVKKIIRIGSCGSYKEDVKVRDLILVDRAVTESNFALEYYGKEEHSVYAFEEVNNKILEVAKNNNLNIHTGTILTSDAFYKVTNNFNYMVGLYNPLGVEMESFALLYLAHKLNREAACILTVSDSFITKEELTDKERETSLNDMIKLALESIL